MNIPDFTVIGTRIPDLPINTEVTRISSDGKLSTFPTTIYNDRKFISEGVIKTTENYIRIMGELYIKESIVRDIWLTENGLPEKWYIKGCEQLANHFRDIGIDLTGSYKTLWYYQYLKNGDMVWDHIHLPDSSSNTITFDEFKKHYKMKKHITENNWYIRGCVELQNYFKEMKVNSLAGCYNKTCYYKDKDGHWRSYGVELIERLNYSNKIEITLDEYKNYLNSKHITMKGAILPTQAQEIINMIGANCTWKTKLANLWSEDIVLGRAIYVEDELYKEGYNDASDSQKKVLDKIFVKDFDLRDYKKNIDPASHHFFSDLDAPFEILVVGENKFQGLYLRHKQYDFKLETTEGDNLILKIKRK